MKFLFIALTLALATASPVKEISTHDAVSLTVNGVAEDQVIDLTSIVGIELNDAKDGAVQNVDLMTQYYEAQAAANQIVVAPVEEINILPVDIDDSAVLPIAPVEEINILPVDIDDSAVLPIAPVEEINILPVDIDDSAVLPIAPVEEINVLPVQPINGEVYNDGTVSFSVYGATQDAINTLSSWMNIMYNYVAGGAAVSSNLV